MAIYKNVGKNRNKAPSDLMMKLLLIIIALEYLYSQKATTTKTPQLYCN